MFVIEYFVGSARGTWSPGKRRFATREEAEAVRLADFAMECRHLGGVFLRRVALA